MQLQNFLLLGKKHVLIARFTESALSLALEKFNVALVDDAAVANLSTIYFSPHTATVPA